MKVLLDTMVLTRLALAPDRVSRATLDVLSDEEVTLYWSSISTAELAIKQSIGKLQLGERVASFVSRYCGHFGVDGLPLRDTHAGELELLPLHHRDPFDRLLIAQARVEGLVVATSDDAFRRYEVEVLW